MDIESSFGVMRNFWNQKVVMVAQLVYVLNATEFSTLKYLLW